MPRLSFVLDVNYVFAHILKTGVPLGREGKPIHDIEALHITAYNISPDCYSLLSAYPDPKHWLGDKWKSQKAINLAKYLHNLIVHPSGAVVLRTVQNHIRKCEEEWRENLEPSYAFIKKVTSVTDFSTPHKVFITHPAIKNGRNWGGGVISWGGETSMKNRTTIYLWHELLHSYFGKTIIDHALIELIANEELRTFLNGGTYPPFTGHAHLESVKNRLLPEWRIFLREPTGTVFEHFNVTTGDIYHGNALH